MQGNALARARAEQSHALPSRAASAVAASLFAPPPMAQPPLPQLPTRALSSSALPVPPPAPAGCDLAASTLLLPKAVFGAAADEMLLRYAFSLATLLLRVSHAKRNSPAPLPPPVQPCRPSVAPPHSRVWTSRCVEASCLPCFAL